MSGRKDPRPAVAETRRGRPPLQAAVALARRAWLDVEPGPALPGELAGLRERLAIALPSLPLIYRAAIGEPLVALLDRLGPEGLAAVRLRRHGDLLLEDAAHAILQRADSAYAVVTGAVQEVVSDFVDGFLSIEDRGEGALVARRQPPPLIKWGRPEIGAYAFGLAQTEVLGFGCGLASLPPAATRPCGLFAWGVLGHEIAGHMVLGADPGLMRDLSAVVTRDESGDLDLPRGGAGGWLPTLEEAAADVLGVLNMGPAAALATLIQLRGLRLAESGSERLVTAVAEDDPHPADVDRILVMTATLARCDFPCAERLAEALRGAVRHDLTAAGISEADGERRGREAEALVDRLAFRPLPSLGGRRLADVQRWRRNDERIATRLRLAFRRPYLPGHTLDSSTYAAHVVAAAVAEAAQAPEEADLVFARMVRFLADLHAANPAWGPLGVALPGNLAPRRSVSPGGIPEPVARRFARSADDDPPEPHPGGIPEPVPWHRLL